MAQQGNGNHLELKRIVRMLEKTVELAQDGGLTGSLAEQSAAAVRSYNATVNHLLSTSQVPAALFAPLPESANLTDVALSSAQLAEYLRAGLPEEEAEARVGAKIERSLTIGNLNLGGDKDEVAEMIREHLAEWFGQAKPANEPEAAQGAEAGKPAPSEPMAQANAEAGSRRAALPQQARVEEVRAEPQTVEARRQ
jgi:hypothetical protein